MSPARRVLAFAAAAVAFAGLCPVAQAADALAESVRREIGQNFGTCLVTKRRLKSHAILFVVSGDVEQGRSLSVADSCFAKAVGNRLGDASFIMGAWSPSAFRSLVADGLVRTEFATNGPTDFSAVPALNHDPMIVPGAPPVSPEEASLRLDVARLGECATRKDPEAVRMLAQTNVNSPEELAALRGLTATFGGCLEEGVALNFPRDVLRDSSVLAYARLAYSLRSVAESRGAVN